MRRAGGLVARLLARLIQLVLVLATLAILVVMVLGGIVTQRGWPQTSGVIKVAALNNPVTVIRDRYGILQITADDPHDLFLAQGYVHAQERLWQMEVWRHISAGRLSELFGRARSRRTSSSGRWAGEAPRSGIWPRCRPVRGPRSTPTPRA